MKKNLIIEYWGECRTCKRYGRITIKYEDESHLNCWCLRCENCPTAYNPCEKITHIEAITLTKEILENIQKLYKDSLLKETEKYEEYVIL